MMLTMLAEDRQEEKEEDVVAELKHPDAVEPHPLRVAPIPARHPYVDAVLPTAPGSDLELVVPAEIAALPPGRWLPHPLLEAQAVRRLAGRLDVLHLHFGFEHRSPAQIRELIAACRETGTALVVTVHDLQNPHLDDQAEHLQRLGDLVAAAHTVITLTDPAAREIRERFGREAVVLPHPPVVDPDAAQRLREQAAPGRTGDRVGIFLKDLRTSTVTDPQFYRELADGLPGRRLEILLDERRADTELAQRLRETPGLELHLHPRLDDDELHARVAAFDTVLLPYRRGTHSGWLEMCRDLGVSVVAPDCGHYLGQADRPGAVLSHAVGDGRAAACALRAALLQGPLPYAGDRREQAAHAVREHRRILREAASAGSLGGPSSSVPEALRGSGCEGGVL